MQAALPKNTGAEVVVGVLLEAVFAFASGKLGLAGRSFERCVALRCVACVRACVRVWAWAKAKAKEGSLAPKDSGQFTALPPIISLDRAHSSSSSPPTNSSTSPSPSLPPTQTSSSTIPGPPQRLLRRPSASSDILTPWCILGTGSPVAEHVGSLEH